MMDALCALSIGTLLGEKHDIRECWVEKQLEYHREAGKRSHRQLMVSDRTVRTALVLSIALYAAAVLFELLFGGLILQPVVELKDAEAFRTVLKILLGTISAITLFVSNYYGRQSLPRTFSDHQKMERFYHRMSAFLDGHGQTEELLTVLAREELIENGNWSSYQRDNTPDLSI